MCQNREELNISLFQENISKLKKMKEYQSVIADYEFIYDTEVLGKISDLIFH